jgi:hypothetical protein
MSNPFRPRASVAPVTLAGRQAQVRHFKSLLRQSPDMPLDLLILGLRGMGKSVLLGEFAQVARGTNWAVVRIEVPLEGGGRSDLMGMVVQACRRAAERAQRVGVASGKARSVLPLAGESPLTAATRSVRDAGKEGLVLLVDDAHRLRTVPGSDPLQAVLSLLIDQVGATQARGLALGLVLTGLPSRGTVGSVSGPTAVAPPPATDQAAYYHQVDKETATRPAATAPAPSTAPAASPGPVVSVLKGISTGSALVAAGSGTVALASLASAAVAILVAPYGPGEAADIGFVPLAGAAEQVALYAAGVSCAANVGLDLLHQGDATDTGLTCAGAAAAGSGIAANAAWDSKLAGGLFFGPEATSAAIAGVSGAVWDWLNSPAPSPMGGGGYNNRW